MGKDTSIDVLCFVHLRSCLFRCCAHLCNAVSSRGLKLISAVAGQVTCVLVAGLFRILQKEKGSVQCNFAAALLSSRTREGGRAGREAKCGRGLQLACN